MALEINEIGIHMRVRDGAGGSGDGAGAGGPAAAEEQAATPGARDKIVEECVRRVLRALKNLQER